MHNKNNYLSIVKAIGIILMVVGHSGCPQMLNRFIYFFHMPLFFFCSGYFFDASRFGCKAMIIKRIKRIYFPYIKWALPFLFLHGLFFDIGFYNSSYGYNGHGFVLYSNLDYIKRFVLIVFTMDKHEPLLGGFWFMKTLFLSSVIVILLTYIFRKIRVSSYILVVLFLVLLLLSKFYQISIPYLGDISIIIMGCLFYYTGSLYKRFEYRVLYNCPFLIILGSVLICFPFFYHDMSMFCMFQDCIIYLIVAFIGIVFTFGVSFWIDKIGIKSVFYSIGKQTLQILALHFLTFKIVSLYVILLHSLPIERLSELPVVTEYNEISWYLYSLVGIIVPLLLSSCYRFVSSTIRSITFVKK